MTVLDGSRMGSGEGPPPLSDRARALRVLAVSLAAFAAATTVSVPAALILGTATRPPQARTPGEILLLTLVTGSVLLTVLALLGRRLLRLTPADLGMRPASGPTLAFAAAAGIGLWIASIAANIVQISLFGAHPQALVVSFGAHQGLGALAIDLLAGSVTAPVAEEIFYRGLLFGGLLRPLGLWPAAAISSLAFAASHGLGVIIPISVLGVGLALVYWRTATIVAPIVTHMVVNAISLLLLFAARPPS